MLKKLSGFTHKVMAKDDPELERALASLDGQLQVGGWVAVVGRGGLQGVFPPQTTMTRERISAMGAAMWSLGDRINHELEKGDLQYNFLVGQEGATLLLPLSPDYGLLLAFQQEIALPTILERLHAALPPLLSCLQIEQK